MFLPLVYLILNRLKHPPAFILTVALTLLTLLSATESAEVGTTGEPSCYYSQCIETWKEFHMSAWQLEPSQAFGNAQTLGDLPFDCQDKDLHGFEDLMYANTTEMRSNAAILFPCEKMMADSYVIVYYWCFIQPGSGGNVYTYPVNDYSDWVCDGTPGWKIKIFKWMPQNCIEYGEIGLSKMTDGSQFVVGAMAHAHGCDGPMTSDQFEKYCGWTPPTTTTTTTLTTTTTTTPNPTTTSTATPTTTTVSTTPPPKPWKGFHTSAHNVKGTSDGTYFCYYAYWTQYWSDPSWALIGYSTDSNSHTGTVSWDWEYCPTLHGDYDSEAEYLIELWAWRVWIWPLYEWKWCGYAIFNYYDMHGGDTCCRLLTGGEGELCIYESYP